MVKYFNFKRFIIWPLFIQNKTAIESLATSISIKKNWSKCLPKQIHFNSKLKIEAYLRFFSTYFVQPSLFAINLKTI
jgi:hypothetical protein